MENAPKRKGPKPKPAEQKRSMHAVYFTDEEWAHIQDRAWQAKKTTSPYIVDFLFGRG